MNQTVTNPEAAGFGVIGAREDVPSSAASTADTSIANQTETNPEAAGFGVISARRDVQSSAASAASTASTALQANDILVGCVERFTPVKINLFTHVSHAIISPQPKGM